MRRRTCAGTFVRRTTIFQAFPEIRTVERLRVQLLQHPVRRRPSPLIPVFTTPLCLLFQACSDYLELAQTQGRRWQKMLQHEHEQRLRLEEMVEQLGKQHAALEKQAQRKIADINTHIADKDKVKGPYENTPSRGGFTVGLLGGRMLSDTLFGAFVRNPANALW